MWKALKWWGLGWNQSFLFLLLFCMVYFILYFISSNKYEDEKFQYHAETSYDTAVEKVNGYLVYNSKCRMLSMDPYDPSILHLIKNETFEACSWVPRLSRISRKSNGNIYLIIDNDVAKYYTNLSCCWTPVIRPEVAVEGDMNFDSKISIGSCQDFKDQVLLNKDIQVLLVLCRTSKTKAKYLYPKLVYENIHSVINPERVRHKVTSKIAHQKALSVLMLGLDSVSRLNFHRTMPLTRDYFENRGWTELRGYNKMGDNTFPNLMAILTGQNETVANKCSEKMPYTLDNCSLLWYNFRNAGYITAYAEDRTGISTFNYVKRGFVQPPTDYYFRPYTLASEQLLKSRSRFNAKYCTGPELSVDRIFDTAVDFSKTFVGSPSFGFFWTNGISHESMNGPSLYDTKFLEKLQNIEESGVMNDSVVIVLSDHGMRFGDIRNTFVGWYEERLPFIYIWLPEWFREQNPDIHTALRVNQDRLTSPYDLYETLRDILQRAGGQAPVSSGCPTCSSLFQPVPRERGCKDAGISLHWCTCAVFEHYNETELIIEEGARKIVDYINSVTELYKSKISTRLCFELKLKRIIRVKKFLDLDQEANDKVLKLFYLLEVTPGGGKFETTITYHGSGKYTIREQEVSRINRYGHSAECLDRGNKEFCECRFHQSDNIFD